MRTYRTLPDAPTGYPLDDIWSVVVPIARTNEVLNPSFELTTTGYTAGAGSLARSTTKQYHGAYSGAYTPSAAVNDGFYYGTITTTAAQIRAISCKFFGVAGVPYALTIATTGGVDLIVRPFVATGRGQWVILYHTETSGTTRRIYFRKNNSTSVGVYYVDGVQSEVIAAGETASTYIDGDQQGLIPNQQPVAYYWNGTPHASTSTRSAQTRAGGMVVPFKKYGWLLTAIIGMGLANVQNVGTDYARIDGAYDDYTRKPPRQFTLTGKFQGRTYGELRRNRSGLSQLFDRDLIGQDQRLTLLRHVEDGYGRVLNSSVRVLAKYQSGLEGSTDNMVAETTPITFTQYLPAILSDAETGAALNVQLSIGSNAQTALQRSAAGVWSTMASGGNSGAGFSIVEGLDGLIYVGGDFTSITGIANSNGIAVWNPVTSAWAALGTGAAGGTVTQLARMPDGSIVAVGSFTSMGGVANTNKVAKWNGSAWVSIATGFTGTDIQAALVAPSGVLYVAGSYSSLGGTAAANVSSYDGTTWAALSTGLASNGLALAWGSGYLYAAVDATNVSRWNGTAWTNIGAIAGGSVLINALAVDLAQNLYAGGSFTSIGGVGANSVAKWNGVSWQPLGSGVSGGSVAQGGLFFDPSGLLTVGGTFTTAGGVVMPGRSAKWNGGAWVFIDLIPAASGPIRGGVVARSGVYYTGINNAAGTVTAAGTTTITNSGTARAYPTLIIKGPSSGTSRIYSVINATTGRAIYLNLTISAGETVTMVFQPDNLSFTSDFQGNIASTILGGSNEADFFLSPGANSIAFLSASSTVTAVVRWRVAFASMDDVP